MFKMRTSERCTHFSIHYLKGHKHHQTSSLRKPSDFVKIHNCSQRDITGSPPTDGRDLSAQYKKNLSKEPISALQLDTEYVS